MHEVEWGKLSSRGTRKALENLEEGKQTEQNDSKGHQKDYRKPKMLAL